MLGVFSNKFSFIAIGSNRVDRLKWAKVGRRMTPLHSLYWDCEQLFYSQLAIVETNNVNCLSFPQSLANIFWGLFEWKKSTIPVRFIDMGKHMYLNQGFHQVKFKDKIRQKCTYLPDSLPVIATIFTPSYSLLSNLKQKFGTRACRGLEWTFRIEF